MTSMRNQTPEIANADNVAERLEFLRDFHGMTNTEFAKAIGATPAQYGNWKNGTQRLPLHAALAISDVFNVSLDWLYLARVSGVPRDFGAQWIASRSARSAG